MPCIIDPNNLEIDDRPEFIFFATHDYILYWQQYKINLASCDQKLLSTTKCSHDHTRYSCLNLDDSILFLFDFKELILINKMGMEPITNVLNHSKMGKCITRIYEAGSNQIIFGTRFNGRIQFINYDFMEKKRIAQTKSWNVNRITSVKMDDAALYTVLDRSTIVSCDMSTGKMLWKRFEIGKIENGLAIYKGQLVYPCQENLKITDGYGTKIIRVPNIKITSILGSDNSKVYCSCQDGTNICEYNLETNSLSWEIVGQQIIKSSAIVDSVNGGKVMFVMLKDYIGVLNLKTGVATSTIKADRPTDIRRTHDHVLVHKFNTSSILIPGIEHNGHNFIPN